MPDYPVKSVFIDPVNVISILLIRYKNAGLFPELAVRYDFNYLSWCKIIIATVAFGAGMSGVAI